MIEDIILEHDRRGMIELREFLPADFCEKAAHFLHDHSENVVITTGFYVSGHCETDGPPGCIMLAEALMDLGSRVSVVTDEYCFTVFEKLDIPFDVYCFPITGEKESREHADNLIATIDPSLLISIERCGRAQDRKYYNMRGEDISEYTARIDWLFDFPKTIGIGDGGNEIGMGNVHDQVKKTVMHGEKIASIVETTHLVISSVSNWGVYGLLTYLSVREGKLLLKSEDDILEKLIEAGAIDSSSRNPELAVDGLPLGVTNGIIKTLMDQTNL